MFGEADRGMPTPEGSFFRSPGVEAQSAEDPGETMTEYPPPTPLGVAETCFPTGFAFRESKSLGDQVRNTYLCLAN